MKTFPKPKSRFVASISTLILFSALMSNPALAGLSGTENESAISDAVYQSNHKALEALAQESVGYSKAYALYRLAQLHFLTAKPEEVQAWLSKASQTLIDEADPESKVLLAGIFGLTMGLDPSKAVTLQPRVESLLADARADASAKGRAILIKGISTFHKPAAYGGGVNNAIAEFKAAIAAFEAQRELGLTHPVTWGEAEAHFWLGRAYRQTGAEALALKHFDEALRLDPKCQWAMHFKQLKK